MIGRAAILVLVLVAPALRAGDLKAVAAEANPAKRARLALGNGERVATEAGEACRAGEYDDCNALLGQVQESVELADKALVETGVDPGRNPRHHKDAEIRTRKILRLVQALRTYMHADDLPHYEAVERKISEINDRLLSGIMSKKKK